VRTALLLPAVFLALAGAGCGSAVESGPGSRPTDPDLAGPLRYVVTGATDHGVPHQLVPGSQVRIGLEPDGSFTMTAGCNTMSGHYTLEGTRLSVPGLATTDMGCPAPRADQDHWLSVLFAHPVTLVAGKDASITSGDVVLSLATQIATDVPLEGTHWVLDTVIDAGTASSLPAGVRAGYLQVNGSVVRISDGCNAGSATVTVSGRALRLGNVSMPTKPCPSAYSAVVDAVANVITGTTTYEITGERLTLTHGDRGLGFRAVRASR